MTQENTVSLSSELESLNKAPSWKDIFQSSCYLHFYGSPTYCAFPPLCRVLGGKELAGRTTVPFRASSGLTWQSQNIGAIERESAGKKDRRTQPRAQRRSSPFLEQFIRTIVFFCLENNRLFESIWKQMVVLTSGSLPQGETEVCILLQLCSIHY